LVELCDKLVLVRPASNDSCIVVDVRELVAGRVWQRIDLSDMRLRDLLRYNLKTVRAYLLKEAFQQLWDYNSPAWAASPWTNGVARPCAPASSP
jgi:hypothetical protein